MIKFSKAKILDIFVKVLLAVLFAFLIYKQVFHKRDINDIVTTIFGKFSSGNFPVLFFSFVLMLFNWSLEAVKWKILMKNVHNYSYFQSLRIIFIGIAIGFITPFQLGDYVGRSVAVYKNEIKSSLIATFIGSFAQNIFTLFFGLTGLYFVLDFSYNSDKAVLHSLLLLGYGLVFIALLTYYNLSILIQSLSKMIFVKRIFNYFKIRSDLNYTQLPNIKLTYILMLSFLRYLVFAFQFYLILSFFGIKSTIIHLFASVFSIFLINTGIPLPSSISFLSRSEIAIIVLEVIEPDKILILTSSLTLWIFNLLIPTIIGFFLLLKLNIGKLIAR